jgi:hypothetical protein
MTSHLHIDEFLENRGMDLRIYPFDSGTRVVRRLQRSIDEERGEIRDGRSLCFEPQIGTHLAAQVDVLIPPTSLPSLLGQVHEVSQILLADLVELAQITNISPAGAPSPGLDPANLRGGAQQVLGDLLNREVLSCAQLAEPPGQFALAHYRVCLRHGRPLSERPYRVSPADSSGGPAATARQ